MVFTILDTPRTEIGDQTRMSGLNDVDFSIDNGIPSPSKDNNDLIRQMRGSRGPAGRTPAARPPLGDRRNMQSKGEFTPLLKSATRNSFMRSSGVGKENGKENLQLHTPVGLKAGYHSGDSPALPLNSSVLVEEHTGSTTGENEDAQRSVLAPPVSSSSALSTPMVALSRRGEGPLDNRGNLATLREQEARLEQIDKENFSLKLKIHFMEEALRKNGREFNEAAIKENTELKVDKVTLQRDLKHYRKALAQAQKDLEDYRQHLKEYAEKMKRRHVDESLQEELAQLRQTIFERESELKELQEKLAAAEDQQSQVEKLQDECGDLEAEIRQKDRELVEKDEEIERIREAKSGDEDLEKELEEKTRLLEEKEDDLQGLRDALNAAEADAERKLQEKENLLEKKDDDLKDLEAQVKKSSNDQSIIRTRERDLEEQQRQLDAKDAEIQSLKKQLEDTSADRSLLRSRDRELGDQKQELAQLQTNAADAKRLHEAIENLKDQLQAAEGNLAAESRKKNRAIEEKDFEIHTLRQKLESTEGRDQQTEGLQDQIADLEAELREKDRNVEQRDEQIEDLNEALRQAKQEADDELIACEDRIQELEIEQNRHINELQELRDAGSGGTAGRSKDMEDAQSRVRELESQQEADTEYQKQLQQDLNKFQGRVQRLETDMKDKDSAFAVERNDWATERRSLHSEKSKAEEQAAGLKKTVAQLQESQGTLSDCELQLQQMLNSEKQRYEVEERVLRKQLDEVDAESRERHKALQEARSNLQDKELELREARQHADKSKNAEESLQEKVQSLEDEIEVLQSGNDEDIAKAKDELNAANQEAESLRSQIKELQQDLVNSQAEGIAMKTTLATTQKESRSTTSPRGSSEAQRELQKTIGDLRDQLTQVRKEREDLEGKLEEAQTAHAHTKADIDTLQFNMETASGTKLQFQQRLQEVQSQLANARGEKSKLQDELGTRNAELDELRGSVHELESSRDAAQQQARALRAQLQTTQRENDRKSQSQVLSYEQDIQNLEQDLADANSKQAELIAKNDAADQQVSRLKSKINSLESELANVRAQRVSNDTSVEERKDLHKMLKDAKLEAEDLALQVRDREARISNATSKEGELRTQLKRLRDERSALINRADVASTDLENLQQAHDIMIDEIASLRTVQKQARFSHSTLEDVGVAEKRHAAELRGLVKQIEYLGARCKREERFRADLGHIKQYFTKQVEMHGRCTRADLKLVRAMGIPVDGVVADERKDAETRAGRVQLRGRRGTRPSFKVVGMMVLASVRMQKRSEEWSKVRATHEGLLKKLKEVQSRREVGNTIVRS